MGIIDELNRRLNLKGRPKLRVASGAWSIFTLRRGQPALPFSPIFSHLLSVYGKGGVRSVD
jgi:hypothetical protein